MDIQNKMQQFPNLQAQLNRKYTMTTPTHNWLTTIPFEKLKNEEKIEKTEKLLNNFHSHQTTTLAAMMNLTYFGEQCVFDKKI